MLEGRKVKTSDGRNFIVDQDGRVYQDATHIPEWQLTPEEIKEIVPDRYAEKYGHDITLCPFIGCETSIQLFDKRSLNMHFRNAHGPWLEKFGERFRATDAGKDIITLVRETENKVA